MYAIAQSQTAVGPSVMAKDGRVTWKCTHVLHLHDEPNVITSPPRIALSSIQ